MSIQIAPSILSADFCNLERDLKAIANADLVHVDVMDHHFVPNLTLGEPIVGRICQVTDLPVDVHLMIEEPARYLESFRDAGADMLVIHAEADRHPQRTLSEIRRLGMKAGLAFNPGTDIASLRWLAPDLDMVLVMSVNPGFGGQSFAIGQQGVDVRAGISHFTEFHGSEFLSGSGAPLYISCAHLTTFCPKRKGVCRRRKPYDCAA